MRFNYAHPSIKHVIPPPEPYILSCPHDLDWIYLAKLRLAEPKILGNRQVLVEEIQQSLYDEGCMAGGFHVAGIDDGVAWVVFDREGCEVDYHDCYVPEGHDGSNEAAIAQVTAELIGAIEVASEPLITLERIVERAHYASSAGSPGFWGMCKRTPDWPDHLLIA